MELQITPPMLVKVGIFFLTAGLAIYGIRVGSNRRSNRSELTAFVALMLTIAFWELLGILIDTATTAEAKLLVTNVNNSVAAPLYLFAIIWFGLAYTSNDRWVYPWLVTVTAASIGLMSVVLALYPEFLYESNGLVTRGPVQFLTVTFEPWVGLDRTLKDSFRAYQLYSYLGLLFVLGLIVRYLLDNRDQLQIGQIFSLIAGISVPLAGNMLLFFGLVPPDMNPTDLAFGVLALCFAVAIFRYRLFDIAPLGRQQAIETMTDPIVIIDDDDRTAKNVDGSSLPET
ncbi:histidine kinase N-terminal 7TM domain-containing protein [Halovenus rubra]|uniref:Histidine kinase N-terminal 7TM domain-containing protein n=2 Tax=Halovenus rubra TaxID=869890 RepID=A0ACC7E294_9EURY|nr:histidine kinase N-terminal 7TM domain-containing protein [Halovenus rubra]